MSGRTILSIIIVVVGLGILGVKLSHNLERDRRHKEAERFLQHKASLSLTPPLPQEWQNADLGEEPKSQTSQEDAERFWREGEEQTMPAGEYDWQLPRAGTPRSEFELLLEKKHGWRKGRQWDDDEYQRIEEMIEKLGRNGSE